MVCGNCRYCSYNWSEDAYYCSWFRREVYPSEAEGCRHFEYK